MPDKPAPGIKFDTFKVFKNVLIEAGATPLYLIFPMISSLVLAALEGVSIALLFPLAKGALSLDFSFVKTAPVIKHLILKLPPQVYKSNTAMFMLIAGVLFSVVLLKSFLRYISSIVSAYQSNNLLFNIKKKIFGRYLSFGKLFYDRTNLPYLMSAIQGDSAVLVGLLQAFNSFLEGFLTLAVYLVILFKISWIMTLCALLLIPVLDISVGWLIRKIRNASPYEIAARNRLQREIYNVITCMPLVKSYRNEDAEMGEFSRRADTSKNYELGMVKKQSLIGPIQEILTMAAILLIAVAMFISVSTGKANIAGFIIFFYVLKRATGNFGIATSMKSSFARMSGSLSIVENILSDEGKYFIRGGDKLFSGLKDKIECRHLSFSYLPGQPVIKDLSFSVEKEKVTAIVGATGSGKTTLISLLMRFYDCPPSSIYIDGADIRDYGLKSLMRHIALVSQDTLLFADTMKNNIVYGVDRTWADEHLTDVLKKAQLFDFVGQLPEGVHTPIGERGVRLSGGERQRVAIARALLKGSEILILDEATSSLDSVTEQLIQGAINEAIKGRTAIVIAHRLSTIKKADKIIVLEHGELAEEGSLHELLDKKGKFYQYWEAQKFY